MSARNAVRSLSLALALGLTLSSGARADEGAKQPPKLPAGQKPPPAAPAPAAPQDDSPEGKKTRAHAAAEAHLDAAREAYGFASWPGREGPARDGIDLAALGKLEQTAALAPRVDLCALPGDPVARLVAAEGSVRALVYVEETPAAAQEKLLSWLAGSTGRFLRLQGKDAPGDVAFTGGDEQVASVAFARGNVAVVVTAPVKLARPLARRVDALAGESPAVDEKHPRTLAAGRLGPTGVSGEGAVTTVGYELLDGARIAWRDARAEGGLVSGDSESTFVVSSTSEKPPRLMVHLLSPRGWRTTIASDAGR